MVRSHMESTDDQEVPDSKQKPEEKEGRATVPVDWDRKDVVVQEDDGEY